MRSGADPPAPEDMQALRASRSQVFPPMTLSERGTMHAMVVAVAGGDAERVDVVRFDERNKRKNKKSSRAPNA